MRGRDVIDFFTSVRRDGSRPRAVALASDRFGLDLSRGVSTMSTGMRQKLALAVTLAVDTPLVILDEPTSNLDPTVRSDVAALVLEAKQAGRTVIFSSHVISEVEQVCDRAVILRQGPHRPHAGDRRPASQAPHSAQLDRAAAPLPGMFNGQVAVATDAAGRPDDRNARRVVGAAGLAGHAAAGGSEYRAAGACAPCTISITPVDIPVATEPSSRRIMNAASWKKTINESRWLLRRQHGVHVRRALVAGLDQQLFHDRARWRACSASCPSSSSS